MQYGFVFPGGNPREALELAIEADAQGWDGFFMWEPVWGVDPWVTLGAIAVRTERIRLGTMLTPVSRRRPWKLASETVTLDHLSNGRTILAVGLGALDSGFAAFGEATDRKVRAELLDEGLEIIDGLWRGQPYRFSGKHYHVAETEFMPPPPPVQQPRIPVWVVGAWPYPKSMSRAIRWDGLLPTMIGPDGAHGEFAPDDVRAMAMWVDEHRDATTPFDIVVEGVTPGDDPEAAAAQLQPWADAGTTWWLEAMWSAPDLDSIRARVRQGPSRLG